MRVLNSRTDGDWVVTLPPSRSGATVLCIGQRPLSKMRAPADADHKPPGIVGTGYLASTLGYPPGGAKTLSSRHLREFSWNQ